MPVVVTAEQIEAVKADMGELPQAQRKRLETEYGLSPYDAEVLTAKGRALMPTNCGGAYPKCWNCSKTLLRTKPEMFDWKLSERQVFSPSRKLLKSP